MLIDQACHIVDPVKKNQSFEMEFLYPRSHKRSLYLLFIYDRLTMWTGISNACLGFDYSNYLLSTDFAFFCFHYGAFTTAMISSIVGAPGDTLSSDADTSLLLPDSLS